MTIRRRVEMCCAACMCLMCCPTVATPCSIAPELS